jgi:hypothetical protein
MPKAKGPEHMFDTIVIRGGSAGLAAGLRACERRIDVIGGSGNIKNMEKQAQSRQVSISSSNWQTSVLAKGE